MVLLYRACVPGRIFHQAMRIGAVLWCSMFSAQALAQQHSEATQAAASGDYGKAAQVWLVLAERGDPAAQFNLAMLYRRGEGVPHNPEQAHLWLSRAAGQGLVDAYLLLNDGAAGVAPRAAAAASPFDPQAWVAAQDPAAYTLQLASSKDQALIRKYMEDYSLSGVAGFYRSIRDGEEWYALVYGAYPSAADAQAAVAALPKELSKWSPWVRRIADVHRATR